MKFNKTTMRNLVTSRQTWLWILTGLSAVYLLSFVYWVVVASLNNGTHMDSFPADGTFQLYNPLRRLALGQAIGYDFPFFHGVGIPLLHYPLFLLLGGGVFAAEAVKWSVSPLLFFISAYFVFYAFFRGHKKSIIALGILTILSASWVDVIWPSNSLVGARGTFPLLILGALLWKTTRTIRIKNFAIPANELAALILLGCAPVFSTEQGTAAILAYALLSFYVIFRGNRKKLLKNILLLAIKGVFILVVMLLAFTLATKGHPLAAMQYAFFDIPTDQGWYFGTELTGYVTWPTFLSILFHPTMLFIWLVIIAGAICFYFIRKTKKLQSLRFPFAFAITYGIVVFLVAITGYYSPSTQLLPLERVMLVLAVITAVAFVFDPTTWKKWQFHKVSVILVAVIALSLLASQASVARIIATKHATPYSLIDILRLAKKASHSDDYFAASDSWKSRIDTFRPYIKPNKTIWSMYTGIYDKVFGNQLNQSHDGEDYIIHALGDKRRAAYEADFLTMKPHYVITLRPSYFDYEEWLWQNHWDIYKDLFTNYTLIATNSSNYLWEIKDTSSTPAPTTPAKFTSNSITLPANNTDKTIVYSVSIGYKAKAKIPLTAKFERYFIQIHSTTLMERPQLSLPSHKTSWTFPVVSAPGEKEITLTPITDGMVPFTSLSITGADYSITPISEQNIAPILDGASKYLGSSAPKN